MSAKTAVVALSGDEDEKSQFYSDGNGVAYSSDDDDGDAEALRELRRVCALSGASPSAAMASISSETNSDSEDDTKLLRDIQQRYGVVSAAPLSIHSPYGSGDDEEDDFELLCLVKKRFAAYDQGHLRSRTENDLQNHKQVRAPSITMENETSGNLLFKNKTNNFEGCSDSEDAYNAIQNLETDGKSPVNELFGYLEWHQSDTEKTLKHYNFSKPTQSFLDAIKKNRVYQRFLRDKLGQFEKKIVENKELMRHVKVLKDFQTTCRRRTGRALSQKKDPRIQLISLPKKRGVKNSKVSDKKVSAMYHSPAENAHVANYRLALARSPCSLIRERWSVVERKSLEKGIIQQFQQMSFQMSVDWCSGLEGLLGDSYDLDAILKSIAEFKMTPEQMNLFLPKVNWDQLASLNIAGRSGAECMTRWLNWENPIINRSEWTKMEERRLVHFVQEKGHNSWIDIAALLGTNRTPFQSLMRFQRSLNTFILKKEWNSDEDAQLRNSVETFGESNWQLVASSLEGRTGNQCSNRWKKSLHPMRKSTGKFTLDEDKHLKVAVKLLGPKTWHRIAQFVPGRTQVQCRERWVNSLDPSLNWDEWTKEEDSRLEVEVEEYEYCWSKVSKHHVPPRTDNQCWRRWKVLFPHKVPSYRAFRKLKKLAMVSNFVDREAERPALGANDFLSGIDPISVIENEEPCEKQKKSRRKRKSKESIDVPKRARLKKSSSEVQLCAQEVPLTIEAGTFGVEAIQMKKKKRVTKAPSTNEAATSGVEAIQKKKRVTKVPLINEARLKKLSNEVQLCAQEVPLTIEAGTSGVEAIQMKKKKRVTKAPSTNEAATSGVEAIQKKKRVTKVPLINEARLKKLSNEIQLCAQEVPSTIEAGTSGVEAIQMKKKKRVTKAPSTNEAATSGVEAIQKKKRVTKVPLINEARLKKLSNEIQLCAQEVPLTIEAGKSCVEAIQMMKKKRMTKVPLTNEAATSGVEAIQKKRVTKVPLTNEARLKKSSTEVQLCAQEVPLTIEAGKSCVEAIQMKKKRVTKVPLTNEAATSSVEAIQKKRVTKGPLTNEAATSGVEAIQKKVTNVVSSNKSVTHQISEVDDDMTLASFVCNRRKKRKIEHMKLIR